MTFDPSPVLALHLLLVKLVASEPCSRVDVIRGRVAEGDIAPAPFEALAPGAAKVRWTSAREVTCRSRSAIYDEDTRPPRTHKIIDSRATAVGATVSRTRPSPTGLLSCSIEQFGGVGPPPCADIDHDMDCGPPRRISLSGRRKARSRPRSRLPAAELCTRSSPDRRATAAARDRRASWIRRPFCSRSSSRDRSAACLS